MKALLVVDIPDKLNIEEIRVDIQANSYGEEILDWRNQTLIPMPQINEKRVNYLIERGWKLKELECYAVGHDDCLDEILGETE